MTSLAGVAEYFVDLNTIIEMSYLIHLQIIIIRPTIYQFSVHVPKMDFDIYGGDQRSPNKAIPGKGQNKVTFNISSNN